MHVISTKCLMKNVHSIFNANQLGTSFGAILAPMRQYGTGCKLPTNRSLPSQKAKAISMVTCCKLQVWCYC